MHCNTIPRNLNETRIVQMKEIPQIHTPGTLESIFIQYNHSLQNAFCCTRKQNRIMLAARAGVSSSDGRRDMAWRFCWPLQSNVDVLLAKQAER